MQRHRKILAAVDGSEAGWNALSESIRLARWTGGRIRAITVVPPYEGDLSLVGVKDIKSAILGPCEEILGRAFDMAESFDTRIKIACEQGEPHEKILEAAEDDGSDLIVLGVSGEFSLLKSLAGSTVSGVIAQAGRDVLIIPDGAAISWDSVVLVMDDRDCGRWSERAFSIAASYTESIKILSVPKFNLWRKPAKCATPHEPTSHHLSLHIHEKAEQAGIKTTCISGQGCTCNALRSLAKERDIGVIVMAPHDRTGLKSLLTGRSIDRIVHGSSRPVLVIDGR